MMYRTQHGVCRIFLS